MGRGLGIGHEEEDGAPAGALMPHGGMAMLGDGATTSLHEREPERGLKGWGKDEVQVRSLAEGVVRAALNNKPQTTKCCSRRTAGTRGSASLTQVVCS